MKKIFILLVFLVIFCLPTLADDSFETGGVEDLMRATSGVENAFAGQKQFSDEDYQKALKEVQGRKKNKLKQVKPFKGKDFNDENNGGYLNDTSDKNVVLRLPVELNNNDGVEIPMGLYKIVGKKISNKVYLDFYQSATLVARVPAVETNDDFGETGINFVKLLPDNEKRVKILYGSMDFNAYTYVMLKQPISD